MLKSRITPAGVIAVLALFFALGGGAYAAKKYLITSTKQISPKVLKSLRGKRGPQGVQGLQGLQGVPGAKGDTGAAGAAGTPATKLWAVVNSAGTLRRASGATGVTRPGTGDYVVTFNQAVDNCSYAVTPLRLLPNDIAVAAGFNDGASANVTDTTKVEVSTGDDTGTSVNANFAISVFC